MTASDPAARAAGAHGGARAGAGLRLIIVYKAGKAALQAVLAVALLVVGRGAFGEHLAARAAALATHVDHAWTAALARLVARLLVPGHLRLIALALGFDAVLSAFEGWALHRRFWWAARVVIAAASILIPFEVLEIVRAPRWPRVAALLVNLAIVAYLAGRHGGRVGPGGS